ncbi:DMT family transporter [Roseateles terrae]|uniref:Drug/metabolite transporter (DMT)-like permease n=1 Tax=Roseateles terrae TaxID=431060 RepID=A0ABR6GMU3_9BURK|nr:DMT family transporter [Roseateles terrae]MBB3193442.1 drug/metabolite transporter (DMT)-like permease [Roseateles terrae]OWQ89373.1 EamA family transporter [Roseateles terrae]
MSRIQANLLLTLVAVIWASAFVAQSRAMEVMGPMMFTGIRFLIGALVVLPLILRERRAPGARTLTASDGGKIAGLGLLLTLGAALQQIGIQHTTVTNAGFLTALYVPLVPLLGWLLLRHWPHWSVWPGALACLVGAFLLSGAHELKIGLGDAWVVASALPWALHVLLIGVVADRMNSPYTVAGGQFLLCGLLGLTWGLVNEPWSWEAVQAAAAPLLYTGVLSVGVAFTAQVVAQRYAHAADAAIILSSETLFTAGFGYVLMGDRLSAAGLLGCGLILGAMLLIQLLPMLRILRPRAA